MTVYDFIIVGAGSAGCVLAYRLTENPGNTVLLIEAGPVDSNRFIRMPMGFGRIMSDSRFMWHFPVEAEAGSANRSTIWVRGKTLGGSSSVNGMIYSRGHPQDYNAWARGGAKGWGWDAIGPCFKKIEDHALGGNDFCGTGGPLPVAAQGAGTALSDAIFKAGMELGFPYREDINHPDQEGIGPASLNIKNGQRISAADAFLRPALCRKNLTVLTDTLVERVVLDGMRATGVVCRTGTTLRSFSASQVILSAGAIHSPKILQLSGIGPVDLLKSVGVPVVLPLEGVGRNLREHKLIWFQFRLNEIGDSYNRRLRGLYLVSSALRYALFKDGVLSRGVDAIAYIKTDSALVRPDAQFVFWALSIDARGGLAVPQSYPGLMVHVFPLRPESQGIVRIRSADPMDFPVIQPNFLTCEYDQEVMIGASRLLRRLAATNSLRQFIAEETKPGVRVETDSELLDAARGDDPSAHAIGTCRIGQDSMAVVDERIRVRGIDGLRVVDGSIMPTQVSGNTNGPIMAMAWRAADLILARP